MVVHLHRGAPRPSGTKCQAASDDAFSIFYERMPSHVRKQNKKTPDTEWVEERERTHKHVETAAMASTNTTKLRMSAILPFDRKLVTAATPCGSGSTKLSLRPGNADTLVRLFGSKQYCWKHCVQIEERARGGLMLYRTRSIAIHCRHLPKSGSGEFVLGTKPPMMFAWTWSRKSSVCIGV
jgi:hypothetical protein